MGENSFKSFVSLIKEIDNEEREQRDRGTLFEKLTITYLENEPIYERLFDKVWMLQDVPDEYDIPKKDTGVDVVARKKDTGELVAVQCKYYSKSKTIRKEQIDSFLNEVGKSYYSEGLIITTTDKWSENADDALNDRDKPIMRISLSDLQESRIDWSQYSFSQPKEVVLQERKSPRPHQKPAINAVIEGFHSADRGKLIMAPGTGKTYTSLAIAEKMAAETNKPFKVLYLVPSIQLLSQTLREWNADTAYNMDSIAVCSDHKVTKKRIGTEIEDIATTDLGFPATTNASKLLDYKNSIESKHIKTEFITVFSTYQSIDVIIEAQKGGFYDFDLIVCDEAHRTTGATELNQESSAFTKVHSNSNLKAKKRLYQTATPRVYGEDAKQKAQEKSVIIADMNDSGTFGEELYRIGFGDAIRKGILTDYKVMVLAVEEDVIARRFQDMMANTESGLAFDDITKIIGCWNGLVKRDGNSNKTLGQPMKRAIAFTGTINDSKKITDMFSTVVEEYLYKDSEDSTPFSIDIEHADGSMNAIEKNEKINWLKSEVPNNTCRVLSNARFLTEGVDVPDLDAVMFLKPRKSKIDIAQAVGRVMRKSEGKDYGYIILPIGIPAGSEAHSILDNNEKYQVVWEILNALRSIDERFDATINKLELNNKKPDQLQIVGVGDAPNEGLEHTSGSEQLTGDSMLFEENLTDLERAIYGKIVQKVGNVRYWEQWSEDVAEIARKHIMRINVMLEDKNSNTYQEFQKFMKSLHHNINDSVSEQQAIEMLSQHLITKPIFEALFESYSFVKNNPVSQSMESILEVLDKQGLLQEQEKLESFYESVRIRAEGIDNLKAKQDIIVQLYNKFFKVGFKETTDRLGIVFTPVEVVDFIIHSVDYVLKNQFGKSIGDEGVHILDPFTGTGTFIVRLLQSGLISKEDLLRKYTQEIHANEIVLLSYYIAAINIEETFHAIYTGNYTPFEGIILTDTFESTEKEDSFEDEIFDKNNERLNKLRKSPIFAIIGNPPYSVGQRSANDNAQNQKYKKLDARISNTYAKLTNATNKNSLYDSYIKAFRWSTDRLKNEDGGVIAFVSNGAWLDANSADGFRKTIEKEFSSIWVFNLRGNQRTSGELSRKEGGKIFGSGSRTPISITILVKKTGDKSEKATIHYHDIGDYLSKEEKLSIVKEFKSISNPNMKWKQLKPNKYGDWINQRSDLFNTLTPIAPNKKFDLKSKSVFVVNSRGFETARDAWVYSSSEKRVEQQMIKMIDFYNSQVKSFIKSNNKLPPNNFISNDSTKISWSSSLISNLKNGKEATFQKDSIVDSEYRPFFKQKTYTSKPMIHREGQWNDFFPTKNTDNLVICVPGIGNKKDFSVLIVNRRADLGFLSATQCFPLYYYEYKNNKNVNLFNMGNNTDEYIQRFGISDFFWEKINNHYNKSIDKKDIFYYIYGILHSSRYRESFKNNLNKMLPHIPLVKNINDFWDFSDIGEQLADLHVNYDEIPVYKGVQVENKGSGDYAVEKMRFSKAKKEVDGKRKTVQDKSIIIYNNQITISNIPEKAYQYVVSGRSAIEWVMENYRVKINNKSGIINDPNDWSEEVGNPRYILDLLLRIINVSVQTVDLINSLPPVEIKD